MAKKSKKRGGRHEKDQAGCWSLMNIFDFRHVRSSQKLILDKKRGSRRLDGAVLANIQLESLSESCHICDESKVTVQDEMSPIDTSKMSVKELMEEEMCVEQDKEKQETVSSECAKQNVVVDDKRYVKRNRRWSRSKMSLDFEADGFVAAGDLVETEKPVHRKHKSCSSVDLNEVVEELCSQIKEKDGKLAVKQVGDSFMVEKQLAEAAKVLVKHFTDGKSGTNERKVQPSKELTDALQMLNSNKEVFLKLLQDPNSQLVKHLQNLQDIHVEEGKFKVLTGSDLLEQDIGTAAKQSNFFWRSFRGSERNSSRKSDTASVDLSRIVLLKPGPPNSKNLDVASTCSSLPESPKSTHEKDEIQKPSFPFTFAEFMRKLKHVMRKDQRAMSHQSLDGQSVLGNRDNKVGGEPTAMASPSRDHFFIERIPRSSVSFRNAEKTGKVKDGKIQMENEQGLTPEQRVSNIYIEAKRHLAEIVGNKDIDLDAHGRRGPRSLGRILSYAGYSSPTICSPRPCVDEKSSQLNQEPGNEPCIPSDIPICEEPIPSLDSCISDGLPRKSDDDKLIEDITIELDTAAEKESNLLEISVESCPVQDAVKTEQVDCCICPEENAHALLSEQNTGNENDDSSCPDSSTLNCSLSGKMEDLDAMSDATSRPSPVSVLEPLFKDDEISPPGIKTYTAIEPIRPRQIKFEEEISAPISRVPSMSFVDFDKYILEFTKDVVQMSGLTWDELLRRSLFADNFINPSLIDEVDFLPDNLPYDFNLLFEIINEVVIELSWVHCGSMLSLEPFVQPSLKGKPIFDEVWKGLNWYLAFEGPTRTLDQIIAKDFVNPAIWGDPRVDCENIGIQIQESILDDLLEDTISIWFLEEEKT